jgi:hypothetical protein
MEIGTYPTKWHGSALLSEAPKIGKGKWESLNWDGNRFIKLGWNKRVLGINEEKK